MKKIDFISDVTKRRGERGNIGKTEMNCYFLGYIKFRMKENKRMREREKLKNEMINWHCAFHSNHYK